MIEIQLQTNYPALAHATSVLKHNQAAGPVHAGGCMRVGACGWTELPHHHLRSVLDFVVGMQRFDVPLTYPISDGTRQQNMLVHVV